MDYLYIFELSILIFKGQTKTMKLVFVASSLSTQLEGVRAKTGSLRIKIMCLYGATCLPTNCWFSELAL
jgi:hypothetical protein